VLSARRFLFAVCFSGQGQPLDGEVVKDALIIGIRHALRPRKTQGGLGSKLLCFRRKPEHRTNPLEGSRAIASLRPANPKPSLSLPARFAACALVLVHPHFALFRFSRRVIERTTNGG
jgi:hypothetical protein